MVYHLFIKLMCNRHIFYEGIATASIVGNALGAKQRSLAVSISNLAICTVMVVQVAVGCGILLGGKYFIRSFTKDPAVAQVAVNALPYLAIFTWFDAIQAVSSGIISFVVTFSLIEQDTYLALLVM